jgi:hypothetical protein
MSLQLPKTKGFTLSGYERSQIMRDPPRSVHTKKREKVNFGDVKFMVTPDNGDLQSQSRINENIQYLPRGINVMTDINYNNNSGKQAYIVPGGYSYAFRPPTIKPIDLEATSRSRRLDTIAYTNPGVPANFVDNPMLDLSQINDATDVQRLNSLGITPTQYFKMQLPAEAFSTSNYVNDTPLQTATTTNNHINIQVYDTNGNHIPIREIDKPHISMQSAASQPIQLERLDGTHIKLNDYVSKVVNTNAGTTLVVQQVVNNNDFLPMNTTKDYISKAVAPNAGFVMQDNNSNSSYKELNKSLPYHRAMTNSSSNRLNVSNPQINSYLSNKPKGMGGTLGSFVDNVNYIPKMQENQSFNLKKKIVLH